MIEDSFSIYRPTLYVEYASKTIGQIENDPFVSFEFLVISSNNPNL